MKARRGRSGGLAFLSLLCLLSGLNLAKSTQDSEKNACGGRRPLHAQLWGMCDLGLGFVTDENGSEAHGHVQCEGMEAVWCAPYFESEKECPVCALNALMLAQEEALRRVDICRVYCDMYGGVCAHDGTCHCHVGRTGVWCEGSDCGEHGRYSSDKKTCVCEDEWRGRYCDVRIEEAPAPIIVHVGQAGPVEHRNGWTEKEGGKLECHEGFAGDGCTMCAVEAVCVPTHDVETPYALALIHPSQQKDELFDPDPKLTNMYYGKKPFRPGFSDGEYSCDCKFGAVTASAKMDTIGHHSTAPQQVSKQRYMHDHYEYHYVPRGTVNHLMLGAGVVIVFMSLLLLWFLYRYSPGRYSKSRKRSQKQQSHPPLSPPEPQQQRERIFNQEYIKNFETEYGGG